MNARPLCAAAIAALAALGLLLSLLTGLSAPEVSNPNLFI